MVTSSDALTLGDHTFEETGSNTFTLSSNDSASWEKRASVYSHATMSGCILKERQKFFALQAVRFCMQVPNLTMIRDQKYRCTNVGGHHVDHESWSAMLPQKCCGSKDELVLILCPVLLCISLPAFRLPHPMIQLPAVGTGSLANTVPLCRASLREWEGCE